MQEGAGAYAEPTASGALSIAHRAMSWPILNFGCDSARKRIEIRGLSLFYSYAGTYKFEVDQNDASEAATTTAGELLEGLQKF